MATATFSGQYGHNMTLDVFSTGNSQNIADNNSRIGIQCYLRTNGYASVYGVNDVPITIHVDGGGAIERCNVNISQNSSQLILAKEYVVGHNSDGTKTVSVSVNVAINVGGYGSATVNLSIPLPTIPRASDVSAATGTIGSAMTINISRKNSAFTHTVKYSFGSKSGTIASGVGTSTTWTPPSDLATVLPNSTSGNGTITVETYSGSTKIGSKSANLSLNVPDSYKPSLSGITLDDANTSVKMVLNTSNTFLQILSNIKVSFNGASGSYGSSISNYRAEVVGKNQNTNLNGGTLGIMNFNGEVTVRATVTDSRGRTSNAVDVKATVLSYFTPQLSFTAERTGSSSSTVTVTRNARVAKLEVNGTQKNKMILRFKYKEHSANTYTTDTGSASGTWTTLSELVNSPANLGASFSVLKSYDLIGVIEDNFTTYEYKVSLGTESYPLAIRPDRVGFGKTPEQAGVIDSAWEYYYNNKPIQSHQLSTNDGKALLLPTGTDLDTIVVTGFYTGDSLSHAPTGTGANNWKYIRVSCHTYGTGYILQEAIDFNGVVSAYRVKSGGAWRDWQCYAVQNTVAEFATVNQTSVYTKDISMPYGLVAAASRIGNLVTLTLKRDTKTIDAYEYVLQIETIPSGYRPTAMTHFSITANSGSTVSGTGIIHIASDGGIRLTNGITGAKVWTGTITYLTSDPFPS